MPFLKIDTQTLTSTTYADRPAWDCFFAAMLLAAQGPPIRLDHPEPQLEVRSLEKTGWVVPPGEYGFAPSAGIGIVRAARVDLEEGLAALERLGAPEPDSRSLEYDGRRLVRIDGGYIVLNMVEFRRRDQTAADRQRRRRARMQFQNTDLSCHGVTRDSRDVTRDSRDVTRDRRDKCRDVTEAEAEEEEEVIKQPVIKSNYASRGPNNSTSRCPTPTPTHTHTHSQSQFQSQSKRAKQSCSDADWARVRGWLVDALHELDGSLRGPRDSKVNREHVTRPLVACGATIDDWETVIRDQLASVRHDPGAWKYLSLLCLGRPKNFAHHLEGVNLAKSARANRTGGDLRRGSVGVDEEHEWQDGEVEL